MRINQISNALCLAGMSPEDEHAVRELVQIVVARRRSIGLENDVVDMFRCRSEIANLLGLDLSVMDKIWDIPSVAAVLAESNISNEVDDRTCDAIGEIRDDIKGLQRTTRMMLTIWIVLSVVWMTMPHVTRHVESIVTATMTWIGMPGLE